MNYLNLKDINAPYEEDIRRVMAEVIDNGWYLQGEYVSRFEREWAAYCHSDYCVSCGNGLDAIRLVLMALMDSGILAEGDEVIVPANTFIATVLAISQCRLNPVLIDPDSDTYLITKDNIVRAITQKTRVIMPVHLYGQACDMAEIIKLAEQYHLVIVEDCAQCHGIITPRSAASVAQCYSFYPAKNLGALSDAGAVVTDNKELAESVRRLANYGSSTKYVHTQKGINSRMDEIQAAILSIKLKDLDRCNVHRKAIAKRYDTEITNPAVILPKITTESVFHIYPIRCERRDELQQFLKVNDIATQIHYPIPIHQQQCYRDEYAVSLPVTEMIAETELSLPCHQAMSEEEVSLVISALNAFH